MICEDPKLGPGTGHKPAGRSSLPSVMSRRFSCSRHSSCVSALDINLLVGLRHLTHTLRIQDMIRVDASALVWVRYALSSIIEVPFALRLVPNHYRSAVGLHRTSTRYGILTTVDKPLAVEAGVRGSHTADRGHTGFDAWALSSTALITGVCECGAVGRRFTAAFDFFRINCNIPGGDDAESRCDGNERKHC